MKNIVTFCLVYVILFQTFVSVSMIVCRNINGTNTCCQGYRLDRAQNTCIPCERGLTGMNCVAKCLYPSYGQDCQSLCNCNATYKYCHYANGCMRFSDYQNQSTTHLNYRNVTEEQMALDSISSYESLSNITSDTTKNLTTPFCDTKKNNSKGTNTLMFGIIGLAAVSFIIYMMYFYARVLENRHVNTSAV